jgi:hypothetical protein
MVVDGAFGCCFTGLLRCCTLLLETPKLYNYTCTWVYL